MGVRDAVVHAGQHHVLESHTAARVALDIALTGRQQFGDRIFSIERHQHIAQRIVGRVQRHRQTHRTLRAQAFEHWHHAGGAEGNAPARQAITQIVEHDLDRRNDVVEVQ